MGVPARCLRTSTAATAIYGVGLGGEAGRGGWERGASTKVMHVQLELCSAAYVYVILS